MSWSRDQVALLIDLYKLHPCLYAVKSKDYKNKHARCAALQYVEAELKKIRPNTTISELKLKFNAIRTNFLAEHRKYQASHHSGMGEEEVYKPSIWYYDAMIFILEHVIPRKAIDTIEVDNSSAEIIKEYTQLDTVEVAYIDNAHTIEDDSRDSTVPSTPKLKSVGHSSKKTKTLDEEVLNSTSKAMQQITAVLSSRPATVQEASVSVFAKFVDSKLQQLPEDIKEETENDIINLLFNARKRSRIQ